MNIDEKGWFKRVMGEKNALFEFKWLHFGALPISQSQSANNCIKNLFKLKA
jgi:hypothetical protein